MIPWFDHVFDNFEEAYLETCLTSTTERLIVYDTIEKISNGFKGYVIYIFAIFVLLSLQEIASATRKNLLLWKLFSFLRY